MDWLIVGLVGAAVAIFAMVDISMRSISMKSRMIWFPIIILIPVVGPALYFFYRRTLTQY